MSREERQRIYMRDYYRERYRRVHPNCKRRRHECVLCGREGHNALTCSEGA